MDATPLDDRYETLRRSVFAVLPEGELLHLASEVYENNLRAGQLLYDPEVTIVASGSIRAFVADESARQVTVTYLRHGNALALAHLAGRSYPTAFQAVVDSRLLVVGDERFAELRLTHRELGWAAAQELSARIDDIEAELARVAFGSLRQRLAYHLLAIVDHDSDVVAPVHLSQLMAAVGSPREVISRTLNVLVSEGIIRIEPSGVIITDHERLRHQAERV